MKKYLIAVVALVMTFTLTACLGRGKPDYKEYTGYSFEGKDPWGNTFNINLKELKDDKYTYTYNVIIGEGETAITFSNEFVSEIKDDEMVLDVSGTALDDPTYSYEYHGFITLKDGKLIVKYTKGQVIESGPEGGSASYQAEGLEEDNNEVTLTKVEAK